MATMTNILGFNKITYLYDILNVEIVIIPILRKIIVQYFQAVQQGKIIANKSQMKLFEIAGFGMLTLTTKKIDGKFFPVGEEEFTAVIQSEDAYVTVIVDTDGYTKAQSKGVEKKEAIEIFKKLIESGIPEYPKSSIKIWTEDRPTVQHESEE